MNKTKEQYAQGQKTIQYKYKICLDSILEFLRLCKYPTDTENIQQNGFNTKQYTLYQYQARLGRRIDEEDKVKHLIEHKRSKYRGYKDDNKNV